MLESNSKRNLYFFVFLFIVMQVLSAVDFLGGWAGLDRSFYDAMLRLRPVQAVSNEVVIVGIDTNTTSSLGQWPIRRSFYADLLERLDQARLVAIDLLVVDASPDDDQLAAAIKKHGRVVLAAHLDEGGHLVCNKGRYNPQAIGHIHLELDVDNTVRSAFHSLYSDEVFLPSFSSAVYELATGQQYLRKPANVPSKPVVHQQDRQLINFYGPPGTFPHVSMLDILEGKLPPEQFRDKLVLVGLTLTGAMDDMQTPLSQYRNRMYGVEVHANLLQNLLDNSQIRQVSESLRLLLTGLLVLLVAVFQFRGSEKQAVLIWVTSNVLTLISVYLLLSLGRVWVAPALLLVALNLITLLLYIYRLDSIIRRLDREAEVVDALLGNESGNRHRPAKGLLGSLYAGGLNLRVERQIAMTSHLLDLYGQLETALQAEQEALDSQIRFVEMLSHEYRTPLAIIRTNLDLLEMKYSGSAIASHNNFSKMRRAMARLVEVMESALDSQRLTGSRAISPVNVQVSICPLIEELLKECGELWSERRFELSLSGLSDCYLYADRLLIKTSFLNLIDNAVKYSFSDSLIRINVAREDDKVSFKVSNYGATVSRYEIKRLFEKFYRGSSSDNTRGAGLGLYLVGKIIEQAGGTISIESDQIKSLTVVSVVLPLVRT